jgi:hypothetical protein
MLSNKVSTGSGSDWVSPRSGRRQQTIEATAQGMKSLKAQLDNPFINAAMTFTEPFPVGLIVTLISAAILKEEERRFHTSCLRGGMKSVPPRWRVGD